jgi:hypothetical protein
MLLAQWCWRLSVEGRLPENEMLLVEWVWDSLDKGDLLSTVDQKLQGSSHSWQQVELVLTVGLFCCHPHPVSRPTMRHVLQILAGDVPVASIPTSKQTADYHSLAQSGQKGVSLSQGVNTTSLTIVLSLGRLTASLSS